MGQAIIQKLQTNSLQSAVSVKAEQEVVAIESIDRKRWTFLQTAIFITVLVM